jgi:dihydropteroate synthase
MKPALKLRGLSEVSHGRERLRPFVLRLGGGVKVRLPAVMGVLNVTPDSFSDGGRFFDRARAVEQALALAEAGADIIDVGGESTRPGARAVACEVEIARVIPVIEELAKRLKVPLSIDTRKAAVASAALGAGAVMVNDVSGLGFDPEIARVAARAGAALVIMHMRGTPEVMMRLARYRDLVGEVCRFLRARAAFAEKAGVRRSRIILDPGLGFAKTRAHNLELLACLPRICALGYPVLVGASRKSFIRAIAGAGREELLFGSAAIDAIAVAQGASIVRVHEPGPARAVVRMAAAVARSLDRLGS